MICNIFDLRVIKLAKKYRMNYSRYADDLTFSTNDKKFIDNYETFICELEKEVIRAGFRLNEKKTRLCYTDSRQEVTGVVVNKKINIKREYYKDTRAMADHLYKTGEFFINGESGTLNQLEGRFSFILQAEHYNRVMLNKKIKFDNLTGREREYQKFLVYKTLYANNMPLIATEGKTDVVYIKAALKKLYKDYPELVLYHDNVFEYKVAFLKRSKRLRDFLNISEDGADALGKIYACYSKNGGGPKMPLYMDMFEKLRGKTPANAVMLLFDNELRDKENKPIKKFCKDKGIKGEDKEKLSEHNYVSLKSNLYLMVTPLAKDKESFLYTLKSKGN